MKYNPSMWTPQLSGAIGGTIGSHNRYGPYFKNNAVPTNPASIRQVAMRVFLGGRSQAWRGLTLLEQNSWIAGAPNFPYTDPFGNTYYLQPNDLFIALNTALLNAGLPTITTCPFPSPIVNATSLSITALFGTLILSFTPPALTTANIVVVYATPPLSQGIYYFEKYYRQITTLAIAAVSPINIFVAYQAKFGVPPIGTRIAVKIVPTKTLTGQLGIGLSSFANVV